MKEKIASIARHILTGAAAWVVDNGWLSAADTDEAVRIIGALVSIILTRLVIWLLEKMDWAKFFKSLGDSSNGASNLFMIGVMSAAVGLGFSLPSCSHLPSLPDSVSGRIFYRDQDSGAKGGLEVGGDGWRPWVKVPLKDKDGKVVGYAEVEATK